jgi:hypothetical protein
MAPEKYSEIFIHNTKKILIMKTNIITACLIIAAILLLSCKICTYSQKKDGMKDLFLSCYVENCKINLQFTNNGNEQISLLSPCLTNTFIFISRNGIDLAPKILLKRNCNAESFSIDSAGCRDFFYPYNINQLFDLEKGQEYKLKVEYYIYEKGQVKQKLQSFSSFIW